MMFELLERPFLQSPDAFSKDLPLLVREIYARRVRSPEEVDKGLRFLLPPDGFLDLRLAAERLFDAIVKGERVLIYGDYDVDGACSVALLYRVLRRLNVCVDFFVPNRFTHGYGLSVAGIGSLEALPDLLVTVDNGIRSFEAADYLKLHGVDLLITDHHQAEDVLPSACAVVNPNRRDCEFKGKNLAGVGVVFYLLVALRRVFLDRGLEFPVALHRYLDLVALGTIADLVPLDFNNRILVHEGLKRLRMGEGNLGVRALCAVVGIDCENLKAQDMAFSLAPRLNAVGRLGDMADGVALLLTEDWATATEYARLFDDFNRERKALVGDMVRKARDMVRLNGLLADVYLPDGHEGVMGIVAARLKSMYSKPALVACDAVEEGWIKASLRSLAHVDIHALLVKVAQGFSSEDLRFGGHRMAAGLSVRKERYMDLIEALNERLLIDFKDGFSEVLYVDGALNEEELSLDWARFLEHLEPWGSDFPAPVFCNRFRVIACRPLGAEHTRLKLMGMQGAVFEALWFFHSASFVYGDIIEVVFQMQVNRFSGKERLNLLVDYARLLDR